MLSGDLPGDSCDSESSTMEMGGASSTRNLEQCGDQTEVETNLPSSSHDSDQIAPTDLDTSQEHDNIDRGILARFDALNPSCQTSVHELNAVEMAKSSSFQNSGLSTIGVSLNHIIYQAKTGFDVQQDSELPNKEIFLGSSFPDKRGNDSICKVNNAQCLQMGHGEAHLSESLDGTDASSSMVPDSLNVSHSDIEQDSPSGSQGKFALFSSSSSKFPLSRENSHQVDLKSCERLSPSTESFKSSEGRSDDILSRSILKGLNTETKSDGCGNPENHVYISLCASLELPRADRRIGSDASEEDISTTNCSLAFKDQPKQSHEETAISSVSDHSNVPLPSPIAYIEYSQSDPYFEPATIIREHNPHFSREVVGTHNVPSSSPPSSPSMNSHYAPSSSPLPSSSPVEEIHTSPSSSPAQPDAYIQDSTSSAGGQEALYAAENYSTFPHYSMDRMYYKSPDDAEVDSTFVPSPSTPSNPIAEPLGPSYSLDFFNPDQNPTTPLISNEPYNHPNDPSFLSPQATYTTRELQSDRTSYEIARYETNAYDPLPIPSEFTHNSAQYQTIQVPENAPASTATSAAAASASNQSQASKSNVIPQPKRTTLAGQRQQQKKLSKPFRSPVIHAPVRLAPKPPALQDSTPVVKSSKPIALKESGSSKSGKAVEQPANAVASSSSQTLDTKSKHRTSRAASQFKSPLPTTSTPLDEATLVRLTPTIQSLERKLQLLRRALKVREDVQEEVLEGLVKKWSEAGREAAWEVWDVVKDNSNSDVEQGSSQGKGKKRSIDESWGWDSGDQKKPRVEETERNWGWDVVPVSEREGDDVRPDEDLAAITESQQEEEGGEDAPQPSLGTMLLQLGIAPETLGWDEEEGNFVER